MKLPCTHIKNFHIPIRPMANAQSMIMPQGTWRRDYCGNVIYKDGQIERVLTPEGYAVPDGEHPRRGRREQCRGRADRLLPRKNEIIEVFYHTTCYACRSHLRNCCRNGRISQ